MIDFFKITPKQRTVKFKGKNGVIFSNPGGIKRFIFYMGNIFFLGSILYLVYLYYPLGNAMIRYYSNNNRTVAVFDKPLPMVTNTLENIVTPTNEYWVQIPRIMAQANVVSNVSPFNKNEYLKVLEKDVVAQAKGTDSPGGGLNHSTYIFAHSTSQGLNVVRNNAVFYLLGELKNNDVVFVNYQGKILKYKIYDRKIIKASEIEYINYKDPTKEVLILQTCWPIGTDWNRLLVFGERI
jgi:LPXTG-site transpeptidase (sortase) family protein